MIMSCAIYTHTPAQTSSTHFQLYYFVIQISSTNWLGHGHGYKWHSSDKGVLPLPRRLPGGRQRHINGVVSNGVVPRSQICKSGGRPAPEICIGSCCVLGCFTQEKTQGIQPFWLWRDKVALLIRPGLIRPGLRSPKDAAEASHALRPRFQRYCNDITTILYTTIKYYNDTTTYDML